MGGIFQRLFKTGEAQAHALVDKLEDPIKMSDQAIRDLKKDLHQSLQSLAEVKSIAIDPPGAFKDTSAEAILDGL